LTSSYLISRGKATDILTLIISIFDVVKRIEEYPCEGSITLLYASGTTNELLFSGQPQEKVSKFYQAASIEWKHLN